jgi:RNA polymerase sigma-70 factor (ECF subfamily)
MWSMVLTAGGPSSPRAEQALASLCEAYLSPLYTFLRRQGQPPHDAEDLTQSFLCSLLQNDRLRQVSPEKGRFRSFLLASLLNFLRDETSKARAQKRGGGTCPISFDAVDAEKRYALEPSTSDDPEKAFERRWALNVLERVLDKLKDEYASSGKADRFTQLESFLWADDHGTSYAEAGRLLGMSEGAVKMAVMRLRQRGRALFRAEVAQTVATEDEIEDEVRHMFAVLGP